ncbi:MAG: hypothetical protein MK137_04395 [Rickettsiales bacterium]|nr:hypothetical protein [Rickettsiales bacterium]
MTDKTYHYFPTVGELIDELSRYDREATVKFGSTYAGNTLSYSQVKCRHWEGETYETQKARLVQIELLEGQQEEDIDTEWCAPA